jgi:hypothetical protein
MTSGSRFTGGPCLRDFSRENEFQLKRAGGGAWRSYVVRSHWRMVFPHLTEAPGTDCELAREGAATRRDADPSHRPVPQPDHQPRAGAVCRREHLRGLTFTAYDPNRTDGPVTVHYLAADRTFTFPANDYWPGGRIDVIAIFQSWFL